jgi:eukaryotic-like serine/threonine-protein kinase
VPTLPADVDAVLAIAVAKDPSLRFASGRELSDALRAAVVGQLAPALRARGEALIDKQPWGVRT